jgi:hypothetical protein
MMARLCESDVNVVALLSSAACADHACQSPHKQADAEDALTIVTLTSPSTAQFYIRKHSPSVDLMKLGVDSSMGLMKLGVDSSMGLMKLGVESSMGLMKLGVESSMGLMKILC